jgi:hypothetical protein
MPGCLPLCAFRQDLLPVSCRDYAWCFFSGTAPSSPDERHAARRDWMRAREKYWGNTGLIDSASVRPDGTAATDTAAAIHYAPAPTVPRLRDLPLGPLPTESAIIFCLRVEQDPDHAIARRLG